MAGVKVTVTCATCGAPTQATTGTVAMMEAKGKPLRCLDCRDAAWREYGRLYSNRRNDEARNWKASQ